MSLVALSEHTIQFSGLFFDGDSVLGRLILFVNVNPPVDTQGEAANHTQNNRKAQVLLAF